jgi:hypothetical protein
LLALRHAPNGHDSARAEWRCIHGAVARLANSRKSPLLVEQLLVEQRFSNRNQRQ